MGALDGKVAVITGVGRPMGIGEAVAIKLAREGADVVVSDICRTYGGDLSWYPLGGWEHLESVVKKINEMGGRAKAFKVDITKKDEIQDMVGGTREVWQSGCAGEQFGVEMLIDCGRFEEGSRAGHGSLAYAS